ncbi:hypothetical protein HY604_02535 [Candidatus Peregrinibacteria bacterium]|nr:hypothetical protein [Candidatus Peregrinibacteria bacterium]
MKTKIKKMIRKSIFLDEYRKKALLTIVDDLSLSDREAICVLLNSEEDIMRRVLTRIVEHDGSKKLEGIFKSTKGLFTKASNVTRRKWLQEKAGWKM